MLNKNLQLAEKCFRSARVTDELSDSSVVKYRDSIKRFNSVVGGISFNALTVPDFEDFILKMRDGGASNSRIANVISAVKWVVGKLQKEGIIQKTLDLEKVKKPKIGKKPVEYLSEEEIVKLRDCILNDISKGETIKKVRIMALVEFMLESGARIGEVLNIKTAEIDWEKRSVQVIGKGNKYRTLRFRERGEYWIKKYLSIRKSDNPALFLALDGGSGWAQTDVGRSFRRYRRLSGITKKFTLHTLRHTLASQYALKGVPLPKIQRILGHASLDTTVRYYVGVAEEAEIDRIMKDEYYDFIPESVFENTQSRGMP